MFVSKVILCFVLVLFCSTKVHSVEQNVTASSVTGCGSTCTAKLEYLHRKLIEMELTMKEDRETINQMLKHQQTLLDGLLWAIDQKLTVAIDQLRQSIGHNLTALQIQSNQLLSQQTACANHEAMRKVIKTIASQEGAMWETPAPEISTNSTAAPIPIRSCKEEPTKQSGKYLIQLTENDEPFEGYCEQTRFGEGWLVIQHRFNGSVDFYRDWDEYRNGFGNVEGEHWLGLEVIHRLTKVRSHELLVELNDFNGTYVYARYTNFTIGGETEQYSLETLGTYSGTAGDSLKHHVGGRFSTKDRDNDFLNINCASYNKGAWWYKDCHDSNLNGLYQNVESSSSMSWYYFKSNWQGLAYSRMLIRED